MNRDEFLAGESKAYEAMFVATLRAILADNDWRAAFEARERFLEQQRFQASQAFKSDQGFQSDQGFRAK